MSGAFGGRFTDRGDIEELLERKETSSVLVSPMDAGVAGVEELEKREALSKLGIWLPLRTAREYSFVLSGARSSWETATGWTADIAI